MNLNIDLKNISIEDIKNKIISSLELLKDKKTATKFAVYIVSILLFFIIYYSFIKPVVDEQTKKIKVMQDQQQKIIQYKADIGNLKQQVEKMRPQYDKNTKLFHSKKEVEDLYQSISNYAMLNGLTIVNLKKSNPQPVTNQPTGQNQKGGGAVIYYKIPVEYQITGNFVGYLKFRQALSKSNKHINFEKERVTVVQNNSSGAIISDGTISIAGLPNEFK